MCLCHLFIWIFSWKILNFTILHLVWSWEETLASLHNFSVRSSRLFEIFSRSRHHQNLCSTTILKQFQLGFYIQMILLELRSLVPLDHTLFSLNLKYIVGNGNISVPFIIHLCEFLLELHWSFPSNGSSSNRRGWLESTLERRKPRCWTFHWWAPWLPWEKSSSVLRDMAIWCCISVWQSTTRMILLIGSLMVLTYLDVHPSDYFKRLFLGVMLILIHFDWPSKILHHLNEWVPGCWQ